MTSNNSIIGLTFNYLTVLSLHHIKQRYDKYGKKNGHKYYYNCQCKCGNIIVVEKSALISSKIKSCNCWKKDNPSNKKHNKCNTRIYRIWADAKNRCQNKNNTNYKYYGGRGIKFSKEWENFNKFYDWSMANGYTDKLTLDRVNVYGNYEPLNCRWITMKEQSNNKRNNKYITYQGKTFTLSEWADIAYISYKTLYKRLSDGWDFERAITTKEIKNHKVNCKKVFCKEIPIIFNSIKEAEEYCFKKYHIKGSIYRSCKSDYLKSCGFKWYYFQPEQQNI